MRNERGTNIPLCLVHFSFLFFSPEPNESKGRRSTSAWRRRRQSNGAAQGNTKDVASGDVALARPIISPAITSTSTATSQPERAFPLPPPTPGSLIAARSVVRTEKKRKSIQYLHCIVHSSRYATRRPRSRMSLSSFLAAGLAPHHWIGLVRDIFSLNFIIFTGFFVW